MNTKYQTYRIWGSILILSLIAGGLTSTLLGQDANWDLKNYHLYNAWSFLNNRMQIDLFAAGIQTYFNPLLDLPYYLLAIEWFPEMPRLVAFFMGFPFGILIFLLILLFWKLLSDTQIDFMSRIVLTCLLVVFGITGSATVSQIGTTFNEIQIAVFIILGITILIFGFREKDQNISPLHIITAGLMFGLAAGLKLTAAIYAPAVFIAIMVITASLKDKIVNISIFSLAWLVAFLLVWAWWGYELYELTGNPVFPMFNNIFASSWIPSESGMDIRFKPETFLELFFYPFFWIKENAMVTAEPVFGDPRFAFAMVAAYLTLIALIFIVIFNKKVVSLCDCFCKKSLFLFLFICLSYISWQSFFSILRYAVSIEVLAGFLVFIFFIIFTRIFSLNYNFFQLVPGAIIVIISLLFTHYPEWGRVQFEDKVFNINELDINQNSLIIFLGPPQAYLAPLLSKQTNQTIFVGITYEGIRSKDYLLYKNIVEKINSHSGDLYVSYRIGDEHMLTIIEEIGFVVSSNICQNVITNIDSNIMLCKIEKIKG